MKAIKFKESDYYYIKLGSGAYKVDDEVIDVTECESNVQVKDINNVIPINNIKVVLPYLNKNRQPIYL